MRGKVSASNCAARVPGITPAYAGKRGLCRWSRKGWRDHPRVCGEKVEPLDDPSKKEGSPPRMRGKVDARKRGDVDLGITPAYAGKREGEQDERRKSKDHPRVCGEKAR